MANMASTRGSLPLYWASLAGLARFGPFWPRRELWTRYRVGGGARVWVSYLSESLRNPGNDTRPVSQNVHGGHKNSVF